MSMRSTVDFYEANAEQFFAETSCIEMKALRDRFLAGVPWGGLILDAGCGSGHEALGIRIHLFVRDERLIGGKGASFLYYGPVSYVKHTGEKPMTVVWQLS
jgi:hypothetical protein